LNIEEIKSLIRVFESSSLTELSLRREGAQLVLKRDPGGGRARAAVSSDLEPSPDPETPPAAAAGPAEEGHAVTSPLVGTFYRRPSPEEPSYVSVGARVKAGDTLCIVEAMKVMNEIKADRAGVVSAIPLEDGAVVEYGQTLLVLRPE